MATKLHSIGREIVPAGSSRRVLLSNYREALLGSVACIATLAAAAMPAAAACDAPVSTGGVDVIQCSGTITSTNAPAVTYTSTTNSFEILSSAAISTKGASAFGIYGYGESLYVLINSTGSVRTTGDNAHGLFALGFNAATIARFDGSVVTSGAGAYGIYTNTTSQNYGNSGILSIGSVTTSGVGAHGLYSTTTADGSGPTIPWGSQIRMIAEGAVTTYGNDARGIYADNFRGGFPGTGDVTVTVNGTVATYGNNAEGVLAINGAAGTTTVNNTGSIITRGTFSHGISANNGLSAGADGNISISSTNSIRTYGRGADGIRASAGGASGDVSIGVGGTLVTTGADATAIRAYAAAGSVVVSIAGGATVSSVQNAIDVSGTAATIRNSGTIDGSILVNAPGATVTNLSSGVINSGSDIALGTSGGTLTNSGTIAPGGSGALRTTTLSGNFVQTSSGKLAIETSWNTGGSDRLAVTGTANVAGTILIKPTDLGSPQGLSRSFTVLTAAGGIVDNGIAVANTAAAKYTLTKPDANTINVSAAIDFRGDAAAGLNANQKAVGTALNQVFTSGGSLGFMPALLTLASNQYGRAMQQLAPTGESANFSGAVQTGNTFANHLMSCREAGEISDGDRFIRDGQCVWARVGGRRLESSGSRDGLAFGETSGFISAGAQLKLHGDWRIGAGVGFEQAELSTKNDATTQTERVHLGGVLKYVPGPWTFAASINGGFAQHDNVRRVTFADFGSVARSESESSFIAGRLTTAYLISSGMWYLKPQMELAATNLVRDGYSESAAGGIALQVAKSDSSVLSATPMLEVGAEHRFGNAVYRGFVRGGATFRDTDVFVTTASFVGAPAGAAPFALTSKIDRTTGDFGAGVDAIIPGRTSLRVQYDGQVGQTTTHHSGGAKLSVQF